VECFRASGGESGGEVGGEKCEEAFEVALVGVGPAECGPAEAGSTLDDTPLTSCCSFSSIKTFAWLGSGSAMLLYISFQPARGWMVVKSVLRRGSQCTACIRRPGWRCRRGREGCRTTVLPLGLLPGLAIWRMYWGLVHLGSRPKIRAVGDYRPGPLWFLEMRGCWLGSFNHLATKHPQRDILH
jgi:hypothetical protein